MTKHLLATAIALIMVLQDPGATATPIAKDKNTEFIRTRCNLVTYPPMCRASLSSYASKVQSSPKQLAHAAVSVSLAHAKSALDAVSSIAGSAGLKTGETAVLSDCLMMMGDSVRQLQKSQEAVGGVAIGDQGAKARVENAKTWVSTTLTDENMCADELSGMDLAGKREAVRGRVVRAARLTSNALSLISSLASSMGITLP